MAMVLKESSERLSEPQAFLAMRSLSLRNFRKLLKFAFNLTSMNQVTAKNTTPKLQSRIRYPWTELVSIITT